MRRLGCMIVVLCVIMVSSVMAEEIVPGDYDNSAVIRFAGYSGTETLTNFPALISWTDGESLVSADDFESDDYSDLRFTKDNGTTVVPYEVEKWFDGAPTSVVPADVSGCLLWLKADMGIQTNGSGGVTNWLDQSGNNNDAASQATNTHPPLVSNVINGKPAVRFSGTDDDYVKFPLLTTIRTVLWVIKEDADATDNRFLLGNSNTGSTYSFHRGGYNIWNGKHAPLMVNGTTELNGIEVDGTSTLVPTNMAAISVRTSGNATANSLARDRDEAGRNWDGDVAELIVYDRVLSDAEMNNLFVYLNERYALGIAQIPRTATVWVQVPELVADSKLYVYWGNTNETAIPPYTANGGVWTAGYAAVYHLDEGGLTNEDSSVNNRHGEKQGTTIGSAGKISDGAAFDGSGDIGIPNNFTQFGDKPVTVSFWFDSSSIDSGNRVVFSARGESELMFTFGDNSPNSTIGLRVDDGSSDWETYVSKPDVQAGSWYHIAATWNPLTGYRMYSDGVLVSSDTNIAARVVASGNSAIGSIGGSRYFKGMIDELRVAIHARSADWVKAEYDSQNAPEAFARMEAHAYWDTSAGSGLTGGNGIWSTTNALWSDNLGGSTLVNWENGQVANFIPSGVSDITVSAEGVTAQEIIIDGSGYTFAGGALNLGVSGITANENVTIDSAITILDDQTWSVTTDKTNTVNGLISCEQEFVKSGDGELLLTALNNCQSGTVIVNAGTLALSGGSTRIERNVLVTINSGATLDIRENNALRRDGGGGAAVTIDGGVLTLHGTGLSRIRDVNLKNGGLWQGVTGYYMLQGTLTVSGSSASSILMANQLQLNGIRTFNVESVTGDSNSDLIVDAQLRQYGIGGLIKTGDGTMEMKQVCTYSGGTTISAGTILANGTDSALGTGDVTVETGGTLGGIGFIKSSVVVTNGGIIAPGSSAGNLTISTGDVAFVTGSATNTFAVEINGAAAGTEYDLLTVVDGSVSISNTVLDVSLGYTPDQTETFFIIVNGGTDPIVGEFNGLADGDTIDLGNSFEALISYFGDSESKTTTGGNDVVLYFKPMGGLFIVR